MTLGDKLTQYVHYENTLEKLLGKDYDIEEMARDTVDGIKEAGF